MTDRPRRPPPKPPIPTPLEEFSLSEKVHADGSQPPTPPPKDTPERPVFRDPANPSHTVHIDTGRQARSCSYQGPPSPTDGMSIFPRIANLITRFQEGEGVSNISLEKPRTPEKPGRLRAPLLNLQKDTFSTPSSHQFEWKDDYPSQVNFQERRASIAAALSKPSPSPKQNRLKSKSSLSKELNVAEQPILESSMLPDELASTESLSDSSSEHWSSDVEDDELPLEATSLVLEVEDYDDKMQNRTTFDTLHVGHVSPTPLPSGLTTPTLSSKVPRFPDSTEVDVEADQENKRRKKRRNILQELSKTETSFANDMAVLLDVYFPRLQPILTLDDVRLLFSNVNPVLHFSREFSEQVKLATEISTSQSDETTTWIGQAFEQNLPELERVYTNYCTNHEDAVNRIISLQSVKQFQRICQECQLASKLSTTAWNLESLLIKPVQRILKYPLLLTQLVECTKTDHPDYEALLKASNDIQTVADRINEVKKRKDLADKLSGRKRNDGDSHFGISKGFSRRKEKLRQTVGLSEEYIDLEYESIVEQYKQHRTRIQTIVREYEAFLHDSNAHLTSICDFFASATAWHSTVESNEIWKDMDELAKDMSTREFTQLIDHVKVKVIAPLWTTYGIYERPKRLMLKRDKKVLDYSRFKSIKDRGDRPDRRIADAAEVYLAINTSIIEQLPMLFKLTADVVQCSLDSFRTIQMAWHQKWIDKLTPLCERGALPQDTQELMIQVLDSYADFDGVMRSFVSCQETTPSTYGRASPSLTWSSEDTQPLRPRRSHSFSDMGSTTSDRRDSGLSASSRPSQRYRSVSSIASRETKSNGEVRGRPQSRRIQFDGSNTLPETGNVMFLCAAIASADEKKPYHTGHSLLGYKEGDVFNVHAEDKENGLLLVRNIDDADHTGWVLMDHMVKLS